eukprot:766243-Hanusia_phi.AAC.3
MAGSSLPSPADAPDGCQPLLQHALILVLVVRLVPVLHLLRRLVHTLLHEAAEDLRRVRSDRFHVDSLLVLVQDRDRYVAPELQHVIQRLGCPLVSQRGAAAHEHAGEVAHGA